MKSFLLKYWIRKTIIFHTFFNAPRTFLRHLHISKIAHRIHEMMVTCSSCEIKIVFIDGWNKTTRTFNFHSIREKFDRNIGSGKTVRSMNTSVYECLKPGPTWIFRRSFKLTIFVQPSDMAIMSLTTQDAMIDDSGQAGAQIEVTRDMIEAALDAFSDYDLSVDSLEAAFISGLNAMIRSGLPFCVVRTPCANNTA